MRVRVLPFALALCTLLGAVVAADVSAQTINTFAGGAEFLNAPALKASVQTPLCVAVAPDGTVYFCAQYAVYKLDPNTATVTTVAGSATYGHSGEGGPARSAQLAQITGIAIDSHGNLYLSEHGGVDLVHKVDATTQIITTVAGNDSLIPSSSIGDGGLATSAQLVLPSQLAVDTAGNLFIADRGNHRIRRVDAATQIITTVAGSSATGYAGDGGAATSAGLGQPVGVAVDSAGDIYISDSVANRVRKVDGATQVITTVAGNGAAGYFSGGGDGGPATAATLNQPQQITLDSAGNLYIADIYNNRIRKVAAATQFISTVAGGAVGGFSGDGGTAVAGELTEPSGVALDAAGNLYIADFGNNRIRRVAAANQILSTVAGNGTVAYGGDGGAAAYASLNTPGAVATDALGNVYIADRANYTVRKVDASTGLISTLAGNGTLGFSGDGGPAANAQLYNPYGIAVDSVGNVYISELNNARVRKIEAATQRISTFAGSGQSGNSGDGGPATSAKFGFLYGLAVDANNNVYIADSGNSVIRKVDAATQIISTIAGNGTVGFSGDGGPATSAQLESPTAISVDPSGNVYVADQLNNRIRRIDATTHVITTIAGPGNGVSLGDGGLATAAGLNQPQGLVIDSRGNLYISDTSNDRVRRVDASTQIITTVVGNGSGGFSGDGGPATSAMLYAAEGLALDAAGNLFIADTYNNRVRKVPGLAAPPDNTPPVITPSIVGTKGTNGWYVGNVSVSWNVTDPESAISAKTNCDPTTVNSDTAGQTFTCTATSSGGTSNASVTIKRDATPPTASASSTPVPNANGWDKSAVAVTFTGTDSTSGIASCSPPVTVSAEGANQSSAIGTCTDNAGNVSAPVSVTGINIDMTSPAVSSVVAPPPNASGWNTTPVTVTFTGLDPLSGLAPSGCTPPIPLTGDGQGLSATGTCTDLAGNVGATTVTGINIDTTPPVAVATITPAPNANGWNNTPVTVSFAGTDGLAGSGIASCSSDVVLSTEGTSETTQGTCIDVAGNVSGTAVASVSIDLTAPTILMTPQTGSVFPVGAQIHAHYQCFDNRSGIAAGGCGGDIPEGGLIDTSADGAHTVRATVTDQAGNTVMPTASYAVTALSPDTPGAIWTYAGDGTSGFGADGGLAIDTQITNINGIAADRSGNVYVLEGGWGVLKVDSKTQTISSVVQFPSGANSNGLALDSSGNVYYADGAHNVVVKYEVATGISSTIAGNTTAGYSGDGGPASSASLHNPFGIAVDGAGNIYIADADNARVRRVDGQTQVITTVAGNGSYQNIGAGDGGLAVNASMGPNYVAVDTAGNLYVNDGVDVRKVDPVTNIISTVAGNGTYGFAGDGGLATQAALKPSGIALDIKGNLYIADGPNNRIRFVDATTGLMSTIVGNGVMGFGGDSGPPASAALWFAVGVAVDQAGNLYIGDRYNFRVRRVPGFAPVSDTTPPVITPTVTGTKGNNGWYTSDVTVTWTVTDPESAISSKVGCDPASISIDTTVQTVTCTATSAGGTATQSVTVKRDATPPTASALTTPLANPNGWSNGPVSVSFTGTDSTSGISSCSPPVIVSTEGTNQTSSAGTCTDNAGNVSAPVSGAGISIDKTPPVTSGAAAPAPNAAGWNNSPVTVSFSATDALSGVAANGCQSPVTLTVEGAGQSVTGTCSDRAGNASSATVSGIKIDRTPPAVTANQSPGPNANGWSNTNVIVTFSGTDGLSGSGISSCATGNVLINEGAGIRVPGACIDVAGNLGTVTTIINIDKTAPTVAVSVPANGATYAQGSQVHAAYTCADALSGVTSCTGSLPVGAAIATGSVGPQTFSVTAIDKAGNIGTSTVSYAVVSSAPVIEPVVTGTFGNNGWYTSDVSLTWTITSGTRITSQSGCAARTIASDTTGRTFTCTATNAAGTGSASVTIKRDATPPRVTASAKPAANSMGWRKSAVTVTFAGADGVSGILSCDSPIVLSEGLGQSASGTCTNNAGLVGGPVMVSGINVDLTPPTISISVPANGAVYSRNSTVLAQFSCSDALSGVTACTGTANDGVPVNTSTRGSKTFTVNARDAAGNTTRQQYSYTVQ
jgi:NHL repeat